MFNINYLDTTPSQLETLIIDRRKGLNESSSRAMRLCGYHCAHFPYCFSTSLMLLSIKKIIFPSHHMICESFLTHHYCLFNKPITEKRMLSFMN